MVGTHKSESNLISDKLKEDIKKLQELTKEANKIMNKKVIKKEDTNDEFFNSPEYLLKVGILIDKSKDLKMDLLKSRVIVK